MLGALYAGTATTQTLSGATAGDILEQLGKLVLGLPVNHVLLMGTAVNGKAENRLTTKAREGQVAGEIARTKENFAYREPLSLLLIDNDGGRGTRDSAVRHLPAVRGRGDADDAVVVERRHAERRADKDGGEHTYMVLRGGRHKEVLKRLLDLCAIKGLARIMITKNGRMLLRGPVDASGVGRRARHLRRHRRMSSRRSSMAPREPQLWEGDVLDAERFLSETEKLVDQAELKRIIDEMKAPLLAEADRVAEEWGRNRVKEAVAKGVRPQARREAGRADGRQGQARQPRRRPGVGRARARGAGGRLRHHAERRHARSPCARSAPTRQKYDEKHCADPIEGPNTARRRRPSSSTARASRGSTATRTARRTDYTLVVRELIDPSHPLRHDDA